MKERILIPERKKLGKLLRMIGARAVTVRDLPCGGQEVTDNKGRTWRTERGRGLRWRKSDRHPWAPVHLLDKRKEAGE